MWSWNEMPTVSYRSRARTVWILLRMSTEICRLREGHSLCPWECRLSVGKPFLRKPRTCCQLETRASKLFLNGRNFCWLLITFWSFFFIFQLSLWLCDILLCACYFLFCDLCGIISYLLQETFIYITIDLLAQDSAGRNKLQALMT